MHQSYKCLLVLLGVTTVLTTASALATVRRDMENVDAAAELELMKLFNGSDVKTMDSKTLKYILLYKSSCIHLMCGLAIYI